MKKENIILYVMLLATSIFAHKLTPTSRGYYAGGSLGPNNTIYFSGSTSYDNDSQNGGYSPLWIWDFDYQGGALSFAPNNSSVSHVYTKPGNYTVAVQYRDNDGQLGGIYTFPITIIGMERYYYVKDHLGSIRQTINEDGEIVAAQDYYAYGEIIPGRSYNAGMVDEKYKFTEKERDIETNYDYFGARYYNSKLGLWLSVDPAGSLLPGVSPYNYVQNNPLIRIDPNGMWDYRSNNEIFADGMRDAGGGNSSSGGDDNSEDAGDKEGEKNKNSKIDSKTFMPFALGVADKAAEGSWLGSRAKSGLKVFGPTFYGNQFSKKIIPLNGAFSIGYFMFESGFNAVEAMNTGNWKQFYFSTTIGAISIAEPQIGMYIMIMETAPTIDKIIKDSGAGEIIYKGIEGMTNPMNHGAPSF